MIPFKCMRPTPEAAEAYSSLPFDFYSNEEAEAILEKNPRSFMHVDAAGVTYAKADGRIVEFPCERAREMLQEYLDDGLFFRDEEPAYYLYRLTTADGTSQTGVLGGVYVGEEQNGTIRRHESTRVEKENGCIRHIEACAAHTSAVFLAFRANEDIAWVMDQVTQREPLYDFNADDVQNIVWRVDHPAEVRIMRRAFEFIDALYIADGHHRAAANMRYGMTRRAERGATDENGNPYPTEHMLAVMFPSDQLVVHDYNRAVEDLNGLSKERFLELVSEEFEIVGPFKEPVRPTKRGTFGMFLLEGEEWYRLTFKGTKSSSIVGRLDVSILQDRLLDPILGIDDPRSNDRIDFVRGTRGVAALEHRTVNGHEAEVCFALYPTDLEDLFAIADANQLMPPKSTWFEPKIRSGLFVYEID